MGLGKKELLALGLLCMLGKSESNCQLGWSEEESNCVDNNECEENPSICGANANCNNTEGSYSCYCQEGYANKVVDDKSKAKCEDIDECRKNSHSCINAKCSNLVGSYNCTCHDGYTPSQDNQKLCRDRDECAEAGNAQLCGEQGMCRNLNGSYWCDCQEGFSNYGNNATKCSEIDCSIFNVDQDPPPSLAGLANVVLMMRSSCLALSEPRLPPSEVKGEGEALLEKLFTAVDGVLTDVGGGGTAEDSGEVSELLATVENAVALIGPQLRDNRTRLETRQTVDAEIAVERGQAPPTGPVRLTVEKASLDTDWTTAAGTESYPGFAYAALLSYANLSSASNQSLEELSSYQKDGVAPDVQLISRVVSVVVSNPSTANLSRPISVTFRHLEVKEEPQRVEFICVYRTNEGSWSTAGVAIQPNKSNETFTVCESSHLSSFAVLMALYPMEHTFGLQLVTKIGLAISLLCLVLCILTFKFCRSIQGTRTTIHLHLCICLFMADLFFLAGISQTKPEGGCRFVASMLHFFFLGVFSWMLLEGVQLYRMVVLVFNTTIRPLYLFLAGYGAPLLIVVVSAAARPGGYGTKEHCWLSLEHGLIWSFFGPVCLVIVFNVIFFVVTVWRLAQKFSSLNPDLPKLHKIKMFTVTAIAQMCILGLMWVFGAFLFREDNIAVAYIFTVLNSLQGALVFVMHCLLSKQVRDEYAYFFACSRMPQKKRHSDFSSSNPSSSQSQASRSGQSTKESHI